MTTTMTTTKTSGLRAKFFAFLLFTATVLFFQVYIFEQSRTEHLERNEYLEQQVLEANFAAPSKSTGERVPNNVATWNGRITTTTPENQALLSRNKQSISIPTSSSSTMRVLKPPFRIVQTGEPRTGSTFQYKLLESIIDLKSDHRKKNESKLDYWGTIRGWKEGSFRARIEHNESFLIKYHQTPRFLKKLQTEGGLAVFSSGTRARQFALVNQQKEDLYNCTLCEIEKYQPIFNLTNIEVDILKHHMKLYTIIRQCCGLQMSKYEVYRLNGCDITLFKGKSSYPNCEDYNLTMIEQEFHDTPITYYPDSPKYNWKQPGDCEYYRNEISIGKQFMGKPFEGCPKLNTTTTTRRNS